MANYAFERDAWNRCRYVPGEAVRELWAIYFDGERNRITAAKEVIPIESCRFSWSGLEVQAVA